MDETTELQYARNRSESAEERAVAALIEADDLRQVLVDIQAAATRAVLFSSTLSEAHDALRSIRDKEIPNRD